MIHQQLTWAVPTQVLYAKADAKFQAKGEAKVEAMFGGKLSRTVT